MSKKSKETEQLTIEGTSETEILARLAERVDRAVNLIGQLRKENEELGARIESLEGELKDALAERDAASARARDAEERAASLENDGTSRAEELEEQVETLTKERDAIRGRVESILEKLEGLDEEPD
jgi:FtsZ-binding cell division protein ZapB